MLKVINQESELYYFCSFVIKKDHILKVTDLKRLTISFLVTCYARKYLNINIILFRMLNNCTFRKYMSTKSII